VNRPGDVLERLLPQVLAAQIELARDLLVHGPRDADPARLGQPLQAGGDVDPVPVDPLAVAGHVAQVDTDAELHSPRRGEIGVPRSEHALDLGRGAHRVERGRELRQQVVAGRVHHATPVLSHQHPDLFPVGADRADGGRLVLRHQPAVADRVGAQDRRELAFDAFRVHGRCPR
jgi:hypothetical protein